MQDLGQTPRVRSGPCRPALPSPVVSPRQKFLELAKRVGEFVRWKQVACPFEQNPSITSYLHTAPVFSEDGLYLASYESESPENQTEKEVEISEKWRWSRASGTRPLTETCHLPTRRLPC